MFTPKEIGRAFTTLFELFDSETLKILKSDYKDEIEDISLDLLAKKYNGDAYELHEYLVSSGSDDSGTHNGRLLFNTKAAFITSGRDSELETNRVRICVTNELWLLEDMTFSSVKCVDILTKEQEKVTSVVRYRTVLGSVKSNADVPVEAYELICTLDDTCMFAELQE